MNVLAIDPGTTASAYVLYADASISAKGKVPNAEILSLIDSLCSGGQRGADECVIEMVASYGQQVGFEIFETCFWIGRFVERWGQHGDRAHRLFRRDVKKHLCGNNTSKDVDVRKALVEMFGGKEVAIGKKAVQGPLYGVRSDEWAALALAVTFTAKLERESAGLEAV